MTMRKIFLFGLFSFLGLLSPGALFMQALAAEPLMPTPPQTSSPCSGSCSCGAGATYLAPVTPSHMALQDWVYELHGDSRPHPETSDTITEIEKRMDYKFGEHRQWQTHDFVRAYLIPGMQGMSHELTNLAAMQLGYLGLLFDARNQLRAQRAMLLIHPEAQKDYYPSETLCEFGTAIRSVALTEPEPKINQLIMSRWFLARHLRSWGDGGERAVSDDFQNRIEQFRLLYCNPHDNNDHNHLSNLCRTTSPFVIGANPDWPFGLNPALLSGLNFLSGGTLDLNSLLSAMGIDPATLPPLPNLSQEMMDALSASGLNLDPNLLAGLDPAIAQALDPNVLAAALLAGVDPASLVLPSGLDLGALTSALDGFTGDVNTALNSLFGNIPDPAQLNQALGTALASLGPGALGGIVDPNQLATALTNMPAQDLLNGLSSMDPRTLVDALADPSSVLTSGLSGVPAADLAGAMLNGATPLAIATALTNQGVSSQALAGAFGLPEEVFTDPNTGALDTAMLQGVLGGGSPWSFANTLNDKGISPQSLAGAFGLPPELLSDGSGGLNVAAVSDLFQNVPSSYLQNSLSTFGNNVLAQTIGGIPGDQPFGDIVSGNILNQLGPDAVSNMLTQGLGLDPNALNPSALLGGLDPGILPTLANSFNPSTLASAFSNALNTGILNPSSLIPGLAGLDPASLASVLSGLSDLGIPGLDLASMGAAFGLPDLSALILPPEVNINAIANALSALGTDALGALSALGLNLNLDIGNLLGAFGLLNGEEPPEKYYNKDVDFIRTVERKHTLDLDFLDSDKDRPELTNDERDILAFATNLFGPVRYERVSVDTVRPSPAHPNDITPWQQKFMRERGILAKRAVAANSFFTIVSQRAEGVSEKEKFFGASAEIYLKPILQDLGLHPKDIDDLINSRSPSYYAQMEILMKKIFQNPKFVTSLIDKPANVLRIQAALQAYKLMQQRDIFETIQRSEILVSLILETELMRKERVLNGLIDDTIASGSRPRLE